ncbi:hypothetical protein PSM36_2886 [Proteiniphilum saccharofermentans]|uniref:Uncharacterized protein n=1 Tax=Proteiniphilum saccharofermentans TaxID=1642647 RepID=A0A1R3T3D4_9BACT|nr:hypothetical protein PSM36_2886 [Proteiniphilum saccharofermentans]
MIIVIFQSYMFSLFWACQNRLWVLINPDRQLIIRVLSFHKVYYLTYFLKITEMYSFAFPYYINYPLLLKFNHICYL